MYIYHIVINVSIYLSYRYQSIYLQQKHALKLKEIIKKANMRSWLIMTSVSVIINAVIHTCTYIYDRASQRNKKEML